MNKTKKLRRLHEEVMEKEIREAATNSKKELVEKDARRIILEIKATSGMIHASSLPPPAAFEKYEEVLPGAANRILIMAEKKSDHIQSIEKIFLMATVKQSYLGMWLAFFTVIIAITFGFILILKNKNGAGLTAIITALGALVGVFTVRHKNKV
jgi:uncharacterized membrane protein